MNQYPPSGYGNPPAPKRSPLGYIFLILGVLLIAAGLVVGLLGQGGGASSANNNNKANNATRAPNATRAFTSTPRPTNTPAPTATAVLGLLGRWEYSDPSSGTVIEFNFQPGGVLTITIGGTAGDLQYEIVDSDTVMILANDAMNISADTPMDYRVENDTLYLTVEGDTQSFTRVR